MEVFYPFIFFFIVVGEFRSSLYIWDINPFYKYVVCKYFSHFVSCFILLIVTSWCRVFNFDEGYFVYFFLPAANPMSWHFALFCFSEFYFCKFYTLIVTVSWINFCICYYLRFQIHSFAYEYPDYLDHLFKTLSVFH